MASNVPQQQLSLRHGVAGTVYVLHFKPGYKHARHYIGWTAGDDINARRQVHLHGHGSPLIRAARCSAASNPTVRASYPARLLGRRGWRLRRRRPGARRRG
jgi:hypothetical protein